MSDHALFYNSVDHDRVYNADSFSDWLKKFFTTGVFTGDLFVSALSGMNVSVGTGYVNINGKVMIYETATQLTLEPANGIYPRIDTIVVERNDTDRDFNLKVVTGDYANLNDPVPTPPVRSGAIYQLVLAQIYVGAGVTEITQANITDTRPDDDLCGIVTGTVQEMDFTQFAAQFAEYYQEFKTGHEVDFDNWSAQQRAAFDAWMADEQDDFDDWFANLHYILDGDVAGHLQNEIDEIKEGMSGSVFRIHTNESTLIGQTVTVSANGQTATATINNSGDAEVKNFLEVGTVTISATDGDETATSVISVPYFGNYPITLAFWSAVVNIQGDENLYGEDVKVANSSHLVIATITLSSVDGTGVFTATRPDTYEFVAEYEGETYSETLAVTEQTTYSVNIQTLPAVPDGSTVTPTDDIDTWIRCAGLENTNNYSTLAEVLADTDLFDTLLRDSNACDYMARSTTWALQSGLVPQMTSNTTPSGEVIGYTSETITSTPTNLYKAFGGYDIEDLNCSSATTGAFGYHFDTPTIVQSVLLNAEGSGGNADIKNFKVQGSNDGSTWTDIYEGLYPQTTGTIKRYNFVNSTAYSYYRVLRVDSWANRTYLTFINIQFYADADITTDRDAMTRIGLYDYCSDKLISNATWAEAIAESEYFEEVLDVSAPKMTSNTTPSGECFGTPGGGGTAVWNCFDGDDSSFLYFTQNAGAEIGYKFTSPVRILKMSIYQTGGDVNYKVEGSNDGTNYTTIENSITGNLNAHNLYTLDNDTEYLYYRIVSNTTSGNGYLNTLQFYGRRSSDQSATQIHSCPNDTLYVMSNGSPEVICTTGSDGVGEIDWEDFEAGVYTIYSSVAKDPNNLSNDYSKSVRVTKTQYGHTTDAYIMPDNVLYWYGYFNSSVEHKWQRNPGGGSVSNTENTNSITISGSGSGNSYDLGMYLFDVQISSGSILKAIANASSGQVGTWDTYSPSTSIWLIPNKTYTTANALTSYILTANGYPSFGLRTIDGSSISFSAFWYE